MKLQTSTNPPIDTMPRLENIPNIQTLPTNLALLSDAEVERILAYYATLSIKQLRQRQSFTSQYFDMLNGRSEWDGMPNRAEQARRNLAIDAELLMEAVGRMSFPDWHNEPDYIMALWRGEYD